MSLSSPFRAGAPRAVQLLALHHLLHAQGRCPANRGCPDPQLLSIESTTGHTLKGSASFYEACFQKKDLNLEILFFALNFSKITFLGLKSR